MPGVGTSPRVPTSTTRRSSSRVIRSSRTAARSSSKSAERLLPSRGAAIMRATWEEWLQWRGWTSMKTLIALSVVAMLSIASEGLAFQCPKLVKQVNDAVGNRFDAAAAQAKAEAAEAAKLHADGKHAEPEKAA